MLGLLARVVIGVAVAGAVGGTAYAVYKLITKEVIREEVKQKVAQKATEDNDSTIIREAFAAKVREKTANGETVKLDVLDEMDNPLATVEVTGDEVSDDIHEGDIILLKEEL